MDGFTKSSLLNVDAAVFIPHSLISRNEVSSREKDFRNERQNKQNIQRNKINNPFTRAGTSTADINFTNSLEEAGCFSLSREKSSQRHKQIKKRNRNRKTKKKDDAAINCKVDKKSNHNYTPAKENASSKKSKKERKGKKRNLKQT